MDINVMHELKRNARQLGIGNTETTIDICCRCHGAGGYNAPVGAGPLKDEEWTECPRCLGEGKLLKEVKTIYYQLNKKIDEGE